MANKALSVAILGSRGIPNRYGGFEACAEELGLRLVARGHAVTVYTSADHPLKQQAWQGIRRILKTDPKRTLGTFGQFIYDLICNLHSRHASFDIVLHLGYTSDSVWYRLWTKKSVHIVNMDGQEWKRAKYNAAVRKFLRYAEKLAASHSQWLVADSPAIEYYLREKYNVPVRYIAYGARVPENFDPGLLEPYGLSPYEYDLVVARMEPENNIELAIRAKLASGDNTPLIILGNDNQYKRSLQRKYEGQPLIRFMDAVYEEDKLNSLRHFSRLYVHGHSVGGTNPSLLEAMACGCRVASHRNPFNEWVLGSNALFYDNPGELAQIFSRNDLSVFDNFIPVNLEKIRKEYNWELITDEYEKLFLDAIGAR